jgi:hypothetical protein
MQHILNIYVSKKFQWYKELFNPMSFDPWNIFLKIRDSQSGIPFGSVWVHSLTLSRMQMWLPNSTINPHLFMPLLWSRAKG